MTHVSRWWFLIDPAMVKHTGRLDEMDVLEESHAVTGDDDCLKGKPTNVRGRCGAYDGQARSVPTYINFHSP